jgi:FixJ family two-component response regulator
VRKALSRLLRAAGFGVGTFATGREFLDSLNRLRPDCSILDLHLPGLSGLDIQQTLVRENAALPCIIITGKDEPGVGERVMASGAVAYLRKPLDEAALLSAIESAVSSAQNHGNTDSANTNASYAVLTDDHSKNGGEI